MAAAAAALSVHQAVALSPMTSTHVFGGRGSWLQKAHQRVDDLALPRAIVAPPALRGWRAEGRHCPLGPPVHEQSSSDVFALLALPL